MEKLSPKLVLFTNEYLSENTKDKQLYGFGYSGS